MHHFVARHLPTLLGFYNSPGRKYHTLDHINFCLARMEEAKSVPEFASFKMDHWDALEIAIWFHDAIYNPEAQMVTPGYSENESIELMYSLFSSWTFRDPYESSLQRQIAIAAALIRATASHGSASVDKLTDLMLDIDLSSLALPTKQFNVNTENVIAEYALFRDPVTIILGNARFLKGLYASPRLFHTEWGFSNFESASRYNILNRVNDVLPYAEWI